jgi:hypothetical protein
MKVVCIDDYTFGRKISGLTPGKIYDVIDFIHSSPWVSQIINDNGDKIWFNDEVLMPLEKWRELQLKDLGV